MLFQAFFRARLVDGRICYLSFDLGDKMEMRLNFRNGRNNVTNAPSLIWQTLMKSEGEIELDHLTQWLNKAHNSASEMFRKMTTSQFYASFD